MSKTKSSQMAVDPEFEMRPEYDFSGGVRGKHASAYQNGYRTIIHKKDGSTEMQELKSPNVKIKRKE